MIATQNPKGKFLCYWHKRVIGAINVTGGNQRCDKDIKLQEYVIPPTSQSDIGGDGNAVVIVQSFIGLVGWSTLEPH